MQIGCSPVRRVCDKPVRLDAERRLGALDHCLRCADFRLPDRSRRFDIHDDAELHINGDSCRHRRRRRHCAARRSIAPPGLRATNFGTTSVAAPHADHRGLGEIVLDAPVHSRRIDVAFHCCSASSGICRRSAARRPASTAKPSPPTRSESDAGRDHPLEYDAKDIMVAEAFVAGACES